MCRNQLAHDSGAHDSGLRATPYTCVIAARQAKTVSSSVFTSGQDSHSLPVIMKRLQNITIKRSRGTFNKMSIINKMKALKATKKKTDATRSEGSATLDLVSEAEGGLQLLLY